MNKEKEDKPEKWFKGLRRSPIRFKGKRIRVKLKRLNFNVQEENKLGCGHYSRRRIKSKVICELEVVSNYYGSRRECCYVEFNEVQQIGKLIYHNNKWWRINNNNKNNKK